MQKMTLTDRKSRILQVVIHQYIKTAKPVGSKIIAKQRGFNLSPATIRSELLELENSGYLTHPYTSAGRVPTDRGYRFYVEALEKVQYLTIDEMDRIRKEYRKRKSEHDEILSKTTHMLSLISSYAGFVMVPKFDKSRLKHIEIVLLDDNKLLVILVTDKGIVRHKTLGFNETLSHSFVERLSEVLNEKLSGLSLSQAKKEMDHIVEGEFNRYRMDMRILKTFFKKAFDFTDREMYLESSSKIFSDKDYDNYSQIKPILEAIEEKKRLANVLQSITDGEGIKVVIGEESIEPKMKNCSMVTSTYRTDDRTVGVLGIIGPKRMEYSKMISLVEYVSRFVNKMLKNKKG